MRALPCLACMMIDLRCQTQAAGGRDVAAGFWVLGNRTTTAGTRWLQLLRARDSGHCRALKRTWEGRTRRGKEGRQKWQHCTALRLGVWGKVSLFFGYISISGR